MFAMTSGLASVPLTHVARDVVGTAVGGSGAAFVDDKVMIRSAAELTRDLTTPRSWVYWSDFLASAALGYAAFFIAISPVTPAIFWGAFVVAVLALYRAGSFIHELTHLKTGGVPGFRLGWNMLFGIPLLIPSFLYEGVHSLHHARTRYGTHEDPEYLPLALMRPHTLLLFLGAAVLGPIGVLIRFAVLAPLSALVPALRTLVIERYSALSINPGFRRRPAEGALRKQWLLAETAAAAWAVTLLTLVATDVVSLRTFLIGLAVASGTFVLNQIRTLVAHLWENEGDPISVTAQYLDSVNVPPPTLLPVLWAPVGLRYHAIHHLLPGLPYHALGEAHRRLSAALPPDSAYHRGHYKGLVGLVARLVKGARKAGAVSVASLKHP
jgi:fatty acid desaturase